VNDAASTYPLHGMTDTSAQAWHASNQAYLGAGLAYIRSLLEAHIASSQGGPSLNSASFEPALVQPGVSEAGMDEIKHGVASPGRST